MNTITQSRKDRINYTKYLSRVSVLSAMAFGLMLMEFPIIFLFPAFLGFDFSDTIAIVGGVTLGPTASIFIQLIKNILKLIINSKSGGIGEIANFIVGVAYVLPIVLIYRRIKNTKGLILALVVGGISMTIIAVLANYFILLPLYYPGISAKEKMDFVISVFIGFNLLKSTLESIATFAIFKGLKGVIKYLAI